VPIAILPLGTANNISKTLGIADVPLERLITGWSSARRLKFDVGVINQSSSSTLFIEGLGIGHFTRAMIHIDARDDVDFHRRKESEGNVNSALRWMKEWLGDYVPNKLAITLDGRNLSGDYILFEAMNIQHIGPGLHLAPDANPGDGLLDVVLIKPDDRRTLEEYLTNRLAGHVQLPRWKSIKGRNLQICWDGTDMHVDDKVWPAFDSTSPHGPITVEVQLESHAIEFLV
jgi:diacylglycerol kinase family enzyme